MAVKRYEKKEIALLGLAGALAIALLFGSIAIATHSWARAENDSIITCEASIEVKCSLYQRRIEGTYECFLGANTTQYDVSDTSDLDCGELDDESLECSDLTTAQNGAAINLFMLCATFFVLCGAYYYKEKPFEVRNLLLASALMEFVASLCAFITVGSYRAYLEAVSTVDIYFTATTGEKQKVGTLDMEWTYGYSWILTTLSGVISVICIFVTAYFYFTDHFNGKRRGRSGMSRGDIDDPPIVRNTLGVPLVPGGEEEFAPTSSNYEL